MILITEQNFKSALPHIKDISEWIDLMNKYLPLYGINTASRVAMFIAQTGHETGDYTVFAENLNYSAKGLVDTWPKRFNLATAMMYARKPEKIANKVYANRMGNGDEASGDGWRYRGKGLIQVTGKAGYEGFAKMLGMPVEKAAEYIITKEGALRSACWFWGDHSLNALCDHQNVLAVTKIINGGTIGIEDRTARFNKNLKIFSEK